MRIQGLQSEQEVQRNDGAAAPETRIGPEEQVQGRQNHTAWADMGRSPLSRAEQ